MAEVSITVWQRLTSDVNKFWRKVQVIAAGLTVLGGSLAAVPGIPAVIITVLLTAGPIVAFCAQLTKKDPDPSSISIGETTTVKSS